MFIAFVGAMDIEIEDMIRSLDAVKKEELSGFVFHIGKRGKNTVVVTSSGIGKVNMAVTMTVLFDHYHVDFVINSGIAGSVKNPIGSVCIADNVMYHDFKVPGYEGVPHLPKIFKPSKELISKARMVFDNQVTFGTFITGDQFITSISQLEGINLDNVVAIDMESAALAQTCYLFSVDFLIIRSISDNLSLKEASENDKESSKFSTKTVLNFIDTYTE